MLALEPADQVAWMELRERASKGDQDTSAVLLKFLDQHPELKTRWADLSRMALIVWLQLVAGSDLVALESIEAKVREVLASVWQDPDDPLEGLLAQRVGIS